MGQSLAPAALLNAAGSDEFKTEGDPGRYSPIRNVNYSQTSGTDG
jgi:hypothetical protein